MSEKSLHVLLSGLLEELAALEHERWAHWQRYMHGRGILQPDGSLLLPAELVARWTRQISTSYEDLDDKQKESDRDQVRKYLPLIESAFARLSES
jgi:hypothetical protein